MTPNRVLERYFAILERFEAYERRESQETMVLLVAASADVEVCRKFFDVLTLLSPPASLLSPRVAGRVLTRPVPHAAGSPWGTM